MEAESDAKKKMILTQTGKETNELTKTQKQKYKSNMVECLITNQEILEKNSICTQVAGITYSARAKLLKQV